MTTTPLLAVPRSALPKVHTLHYACEAPEACIEYIILGETVVYCGVSYHRALPTQVTTTNATARIIEALASTITPSPKRVCEFTTHWSWIPQPGEYDFEKIEIITSDSRGHKRRFPHVKREKIPCPPEVLAIFSRWIGGSNPKRYVPQRELFRDP